MIEIYDNLDKATIRMEYNNETKEMSLVILPSQLKEYLSDTQELLFPPPSINISLEIDKVVELCEILVLANSRLYMDNKKLLTTIETKNYKLIIKKVFDNHNRFKTMINVIDVDNNTVICLKFTQKICFILIRSIRNLLVRNGRNSFSIPVKDENNITFRINHDKNNFSINYVWLRNNEISILRYLIEKIIFENTIKRVGDIRGKLYRQIAIINTQNKIIFGFKHAKKENKGIFLFLSPYLIAAFYLSLPGAIKYEEKFNHELLL